MCTVVLVWWWWSCGGSVVLIGGGGGVVWWCWLVVEVVLCGGVDYWWWRWCGVVVLIGSIIAGEERGGYSFCVFFLSVWPDLFWYIFFLSRRHVDGRIKLFCRFYIGGTFQNFVKFWRLYSRRHVDGIISIYYK